MSSSFTASSDLPFIYLYRFKEIMTGTMAWNCAIGVSRSAQLKIKKQNPNVHNIFKTNNRWDNISCLWIQALGSFHFPLVSITSRCSWYVSFHVLSMLGSLKSQVFHDCWTCIVFAAHMNFHFHIWFYFQGHPVIGVVWFTRFMVFVFFLIFSLSLDV